MCAGADGAVGGGGRAAPAAASGVSAVFGVSGASTQIAGWLLTRPARVGNTRVLAIDGRSGAGKTTLAQAVAGRLAAPVLHMDDLYDGWDGLRPGIDRLVEQVLLPIAAGRPARWRSYDWHNDRPGPWHEHAGGDVLIVEGVGAGARAAAGLLSALVCVSAPGTVRRRRAIARDGDTFAPHWQRWAHHERRYFAAEDVAGRADILVNGAKRHA